MPWKLREAKCTHFELAVHTDAENVEGCEECLKIGGEWVHLRRCMVCGVVGCCDNSPNIHATRHFQETGHPLARTGERVEAWGWCYPDKVVIPDVAMLQQ